MLVSFLFIDNLSLVHHIDLVISIYEYGYCNIIHVDKYLSTHCTEYQWISNDSLQWRHNGGDSVSNHQPQDCLLSRLFRRRSKKTAKLCVTGLSAVNSPVTDEFTTQMASNAENVSIWWRHRVLKTGRAHEPFTKSIEAIVKMVSTRSNVCTEIRSTKQNNYSSVLKMGICQIMFFVLTYDGSNGYVRSPRNQ